METKLYRVQLPKKTKGSRSLITRIDGKSYHFDLSEEAKSAHGYPIKDIELGEEDALRLRQRGFSLRELSAKTAVNVPEDETTSAKEIQP